MKGWPTNPKSLVVLRGRVNGLTRGLLAGGKHGTTVVDQAQFNIDGVEITSRTSYEPVMVKDGDDFIAAGYFRGSVLEMSAWWNVTERNGYEPKTWAYGFWMSLSLLLSIPIIWALASPNLVMSPRSAGAIVMPLFFSLFMARSAFLRRKETRAIRLARSGKFSE